MLFTFTIGLRYVGFVHITADLLLGAEGGVADVLLGG